jgi:hypothetical protein
VVPVSTGLAYVGAAALTHRGNTNSWLFVVADGHIGTVHIMVVDGHNGTVDSRFRFLCGGGGGYNCTSTPVDRTDGHPDAVGYCCCLLSRMATMALSVSCCLLPVFASYQWLRKHCRFLLLFMLDGHNGTVRFLFIVGVPMVILTLSAIN